MRHRRRLKHLGYPADAFDEGIDFFLCIIHGKGGTHGAEHTETFHERLRTVVTRADGNAETVEECAEVGMMDIADIERDDSLTASCRGGVDG